MSGGGNPFQGFKPGDLLAANLGNSITGWNIGGQGGMSNDFGTHVGNNLTGLNLFNAGNNSIDAANASNMAANPSTIPMLPNVGAPQFRNPSSFAMPTPQGGFWNQIAQQMAGPVYTGGLQVPGVSPAMRNQPLGQPMASSGGKGAIPQTLAAPQATSLPGNYIPGTIRGMKGFYAQ